MKAAKFFNITVIFYKEGDNFIAHAPSIDLCTAGKSFDDAKSAFDEAFKLFINELEHDGNLEKVLSECGWKKLGTTKRWIEPRHIATVNEEIAV